MASRWPTVVTQGVKQALKRPTSGERTSFGVTRHNHSNSSCIVTSGQLQRVTSGVNHTFTRTPYQVETQVTQIQVKVWSTVLHITQTRLTVLHTTLSCLTVLHTTLPCLSVLHTTLPWLTVLHTTQPWLTVLHTTQPWLTVLHTTQPRLTVLHTTQPWLTVLHTTLPWLTALHTTLPWLTVLHATKSSKRNQSQYKQRIPIYRYIQK